MFAVDMKTFTRIAVIVHTLVLFAIYSFLSVKAFGEFRVDWDYLTYHLPDALARFGLTTYLPERELEEINQAWPPLPHLVQGALVYISGAVVASKGASAIAFLSLLMALSYLFRENFSWRWFLTACLAVPLFSFHFISGYVDLFSASCLAIMIASYLRLEEGVSEGRFEKRVYLLFVLGAALSMLTKLQAWPTTAFFAGYIAVRFIFYVKRSLVSKTQCVLYLFCLFALVGAWPMRNLSLYRNPTYPVEFPFLSAIFSNYKQKATSTENIPFYLREKKIPLRFVHSVFELNRFYTNEEYLWTHDQAALLVPNSPHHRMGGWFVLTVGLLVSIALLSFYWRFLPIWVGLIFLGSVMLISILPQSHDLRYWLFVPLSLAIFFGRSLPKFSKKFRFVMKLGIFVSAAYVLWKIDLFYFDSRPPRAFAPVQAVSFWEEQKGKPQTTLIEICGKMPHTIFWSGPTFNEYLVRGCF